MNAKLKKGMIFSETNFLKVQEVNASGIVAVSCTNPEKVIEIPKDYMQQMDNFSFADLYESEESVGITEAVDILMKNMNKCMSVFYDKKPTEVSDKKYAEEKAERIKKALKAPAGNLAKEIEDIIDNPPLKLIPGEERLIKGYHEGRNNELGRLNFFDLEEAGAIRQVDLRTIKYFIVDKIKFNVKRR